MRHLFGTSFFYGKGSRKMMRGRECSFPASGNHVIRSRCGVLLWCSAWLCVLLEHFYRSCVSQYRLNHGMSNLFFAIGWYDCMYSFSNAERLENQGTSSERHRSRWGSLRWIDGILWTSNEGRLHWKTLRRNEVSEPCRQMPFLPEFEVQIDKKKL